MRFTRDSLRCWGTRVESRIIIELVGLFETASLHALFSLATCRTRHRVLLFAHPLCMGLSISHKQLMRNREPCYIILREATEAAPNTNGKKTEASTSLTVISISFEHDRVIRIRIVYRPLELFSFAFSLFFRSVPNAPIQNHVPRNNSLPSECVRENARLHCVLSVPASERERCQEITILTPSMHGEWERGVFIRMGYLQIRVRNLSVLRELGMPRIHYSSNVVSSKYSDFNNLYRILFS